MEDGIEEERRLFYVGITRAIDNLFIFSPKTIRGKFYNKSRFISESDLEKESEASLFSRRQRGILGCWSKCQFPYKGLAVQWGKAKERQARFLF